MGKFIATIIKKRLIIIRLHKKGLDIQIPFNINKKELTTHI